MIEKSDIIKAWVILRKSTEVQSIPDKTLDFVKDVSLKALEEMKKEDEKEKLIGSSTFI